MYGCTDVLRVRLEVIGRCSRIKSRTCDSVSMGRAQFVLIGRGKPGDGFNPEASQVLYQQANGCAGGPLSDRHLLRYSRQYGNRS